MLVPPSFLFALDLSCGVTSCHSCGVMSTTAQLCSRAISPKVVCDLLRNSVSKAQYIIQGHMGFCKPGFTKLYGI